MSEVFEYRRQKTSVGTRPQLPLAQILVEILKIGLKRLSVAKSRHPEQKLLNALRKWICRTKE